MTTDFITVLTHSTTPLSKRWCADGSIQAFGHAKHFAAREIPVSSFGEMAATLSALHGKPRSCIIRGRFTGQDLTNTVRQKDVFTDTEHHWLLIDVDKYQPLEVDPVTEPVESIEQYIHEHLPQEFHETSYHWQLSNSAGHPTKQGLRAHLWFWSETPHTSATLRAWADGLTVDRSLFDEIQIHYTAAPVFDEGVADPVPLRAGTVRKASDVVQLTAAPAAPSERISRQQVARETLSTDPVAQLLYEKGLVKSERRNDMGLNIECPCSDRHTSESGESSTIYYPANTGGYAQRAFKCLHAGCTGAPQADFLEALGYEEPSIADDFDDVSSESTDSDDVSTKAPEIDTFHHHVPFEQRPVARYLIKQWLPAQGVAVVYGASGSGKSFFTLDMVMAVVRDQPWHGHRVCGGAVAYLCAEGFTDFQDRVDAIGLHQQVDPSTLPLYLRGRGITWLQAEKIKDLIRELRKIPGLRMLVIDTLAKVIAGENENAAEVMTKAVHHAEEIARVLGILVLIVHHTGKDEGRGLRGHSALEAGIDSAIYVARPEKGAARSGEVTKLKGGAEGAKIDFKLELMSLNRRDEDGDHLFSCIVEDCAAPIVTKKLGVNQEALLAEFELAFDLTGVAVGKKALVKAACERRKEAEGKAPRLQTVAEVLEELVEKGVLRETDEGIVRG